MADNASLLALLNNEDLTNFSSQVAAQDPYNIARQALGSYAPDTSMMGAGGKFANSFGAAFLSGYLGNKSQENVRNQVNAVTSVLPQLYSNPLSVATPEGIDEQAFSNLRANATLKSLVNAERKKEKSEDFNVELLSKFMGKKADILGEASAKKDLYGADFANKDPDNPFFKATQEELKTKRAEEDSARKEIGLLPAVQSFNSASTGIAKIKSLKDLDTSTSDIPFIYAFIQGQDGGVVKEGEFTKVEGANPLLQKYSAQLNAALNGQSALTPTIKRQMFAELQGTQAVLYDEAKRQAAQRLKIASGRGADVQDAIPFDPSMQLGATQTPSVDASSIPPGMKLQRNKATGATRLVPIG